MPESTNNIEDFYIETINEYLINVYELYDGNLIEGLSYTMYNVKNTYENQKFYALTLFVLYNLLNELLSINKIRIYPEEAEHINFWLWKLDILIYENYISILETGPNIINIIQKNEDEIINYIREHQ